MCGLPENNQKTQTHATQMSHKLKKSIQNTLCSVQEVTHL